jgi:endonuclease/exonuclease/phosphatase family metal-dependent hydrolase
MKKQLRLVAVAAVLAPLASLGTAGTADADDTVTTVVRVATYNVQVRRSVAEFTAGVTRLAARSDIVGLQEMDSREKEAVLGSMADSGWSYYWNRTAYQMPVMWRHDRFALAGTRVARMSDPTYIGNELPGAPSYQKARYVMIVRLLDKVTGRKVSVVNVHLLRGAVRGGRPWPDRPRVFALYKTQLANLTAIAAGEKRWGRTFVTGDYNAGWVADRKHLLRRLPIRRFGSIGMTSMWAYSRPTNGLGTRNDALIDQVFTNMRPISSRVQFDLSGYSDHRPAIATYATD